MNSTFYTLYVFSDFRILITLGLEGRSDLENKISAFHKILNHQFKFLVNFSLVFQSSFNTNPLIFLTQSLVLGQTSNINPHGTFVIHCYTVPVLEGQVGPTHRVGIV